MSICIRVKTPTGDEIWPQVLDMGYSGAEETLTVNGSDGSGAVFQKVYFCGQWLDVTTEPHSNTDYSVPHDAKRIL